MRPIYYRLDEFGEAIPCDFLEGTRLLAMAEGRLVGRTRLPDGRMIATAFLVFDHAPFAKRPVLFDTVLYGADGTERVIARYSNRREAERGHSEFASLIRLLG
ncbi:MAG TPA: hypothetical protein PLL78_06065 [Fimbriimonadaceae bacterium]|nr:hypothetical protein [Fimbriimonadaceae bacterium]HRJ96232.1 hypothetical protein [Fimbriimonadaceae bacterium]